MGYSINLYRTSSNLELTEENMFDIAYSNSKNEGKLCAEIDFALDNPNVVVFQEVFNIPIGFDDNFTPYDKLQLQQAKKRFYSGHIENSVIKKKIEIFLHELDKAIDNNSNVFFVCD